MEQREQTGTRSRSAESRQRKTEGQQTMEEYLLSQLDTPVVLKDGSSESNAESHSSIAESRQSSPIGNGIPYKDIVEQARLYIHTLGGFEKFAEWGLVRPLAQV